MKFLILISLFATIFAENQRLIIGILDQPSAETGYKPSEWNYIAASYVKYLESSGARIVPINYFGSHDYFDWILSQINGLFLPGGDTDFIDKENKTTIFAENAGYLWQKAIQMNDNGDYFPVWGTCQGFQLLHFLIAGNNYYNVEFKLPGENSVARKVIYTKEARQYSNFLGPMEAELFEYSQQYVSVYLNHHQSIIDKSYHNYPVLDDFFHRVAYGSNEDGEMYVTFVEARKYPVWGSQYHPEKVNFEWLIKNVPRGLEPIKFTQYHSNFFVQECRKNSHQFDNATVEEQTLIYNYNPIYTPSGSFDQVYMFLKNETLNTVNIL